MEGLDATRMSRGDLYPDLQKSTHIFILATFLILAVLINETLSLTAVKPDSFLGKNGRYINVLVAIIGTIIPFFSVGIFAPLRVGLLRTDAVSRPMRVLSWAEKSKWANLVLLVIILANEIIHAINEIYHFIPENNKVGKFYIENNKYLTAILSVLIVISAIIQTSVLRHEAKLHRLRVRIDDGNNVADASSERSERSLVWRTDEHGVRVLGPAPSERVSTFSRRRNINEFRRHLRS